jgi:hypothetical protein
MSAAIALKNLVKKRWTDDVVAKGALEDTEDACSADVTGLVPSFGDVY